MVLLFLGLFSVAASSQPIPGRFVVKLSRTAQVASVQAALPDDVSFTQLSPSTVSDRLVGAESWSRWQVFATQDLSMTLDDVRGLIGDANIEYIEPDYKLQFFDLPTDELFSHQWYLNNQGQSYWGIDRLEGYGNDTLALFTGTVGQDIGLSEYYASPPAEATRVVVAIIDSGVDTDHPQLAGQFWTNDDEIPSNGIDDDHNGFVDDTLGFDVSGDTINWYNPEGDNEPDDEVGHGTHIAGIVAARADGIGVVGITPQFEIMPVKIRPNATSSIGAAGIMYAVLAGADVINISWGSEYESFIVREALRVARDNDVFVAVAAGNSGDNSRFYPAALDSVYTVAASDADGNSTVFTTYGGHLEITASGQSILSLRADGTDMYVEGGEPGVHIIGDDSLYYLASGTSMATPMVAAAGALIKAVRPDFDLWTLQDVLNSSARDMIDPFGIGDNLPGFDSISGHGHLDIDACLDLAVSGGAYFVSPVRRTRYVDSVDVRIAGIDGFNSSWQIDYRLAGEETWTELTSGMSLPIDSVAWSFDDSWASGVYTLRLADNTGRERTVTFTLVTSRRVEITSPVDSTELQYSVPLRGFVHGAGLDSSAITLIDSTGSATRLAVQTGEYIDSLIYQWNASGGESGLFRLVVDGFFIDETLTDTVVVLVSSAFAEGWPRSISGRGSLSATCADLDDDGTKEILVGSTNGLHVFEHNGVPREGFPALTGLSAQSIPAAYDVDADGFKEIIFLYDSGLAVVNEDGTMQDGWPRPSTPSRTGFGAPVAAVTQFDPYQDSVICFVTTRGEVMAYHFDGSPYFYSLGGWFASFTYDQSATYTYAWNGTTGADVDGDGINEVIVSYSASGPEAGVGLFDARTGLPAFDRPSKLSIDANVVYGTILADLTLDGLPEIISNGYDSTGLRSIWVRTQGFENLPGWPVTMPEVAGYRGNYTMVADLDLDGVPEIMVSFLEFDIGVIYAFRADGSPYISIDGRPAGEAYRYPATIGAPVAADIIGDQHPEVIFRTGYIFPGTGTEKVHILDWEFNPIPGWPVSTPVSTGSVFSTPYNPSVDDVDGDGLQELILVSEGLSVMVWDMESAHDPTVSNGKLYIDEINSAMYKPAPIISDVTDDDNPKVLPRTFALNQNFPNPFNPTTKINFELPSQAFVRLDVFNVLGQTVATVVNQVLPGGSHTVDFDGTGLASGVYLYRLTSGNQTTTRKMVLLK